MPISVCGRVKPKVKPVLLVQPPFVSVKSFPTRRQNVKSYFCRLLSVSDSRLADVPGAWFYKQRLHRIAIWLRRSFSVGSSFLKQGWFFYLEANILHWYCSRKMTGGLICSPVWLLLNLTCVRSWGGVSETGCLPTWGILFREDSVRLRQCNILLPDLNIYLIFSWQQWNATRSENSFREM